MWWRHFYTIFPISSLNKKAMRLMGAYCWHARARAQNDSNELKTFLNICNLHFLWAFRIKVNIWFFCIHNFKISTYMWCHILLKTNGRRNLCMVNVSVPYRFFFPGIFASSLPGPVAHADNLIQVMLPKVIMWNHNLFALWNFQFPFGLSKEKAGINEL